MAEKKANRSAKKSVTRKRTSKSKADASGARPTTQKKTKKSGQKDGAAVKDREGLPGKASLQDILGRTDQIGTILTKGLDLAEAGIGLGINLIGKLSSVASDQIIGNITKGVMPGGQARYPRQEDESYQTPGRQQDEEEAPDGENVTREMCIVNRSPVFPGSPVRISFSINNDSSTAVKKVCLEIEDFMGATQGFNMPKELFSIKPAEVEIEPKDFEKFILTGVLPDNTPEDSYNGWIRIAGEEGMKLPVILMVTGRR